VGVGDPSTWTRDPYLGEVRDGIVYGRGAGDQEAGIAAAVHGARIAKDLGLLDGVQVWVTGTVMEEDCDGLCWQYILREGVLAPDVVVITEPTNLGVYRGHRGRMEIEVRTQGRSCHGSAPERGVNAVYLMAPIIADIERLNDALAPRPIPSWARARHHRRHPLDVAVALRGGRQRTIHLDRRLTHGETIESAVRRSRGSTACGAPAPRSPCSTTRVRRTRASPIPRRSTSRRGSWTRTHPRCVRAWRRRRRRARPRPRRRQVGLLDQRHRHARPVRRADDRLRPRRRDPRAHADDQCPIDHLTAAAAFYALFPQAYRRAATDAPLARGCRPHQRERPPMDLHARIDALAASTRPATTRTSCSPGEQSDAALRFIVDAAEVLQALVRRPSRRGCSTRASGSRSSATSRRARATRSAPGATCSA
jgi:hypothetical protein